MIERKEGVLVDRDIHNLIKISRASASYLSIFNLPPLTFRSKTPSSKQPVYQAQPKVSRLMNSLTTTIVTRPHSSTGRTLSTRAYRTWPSWPLMSSCQTTSPPTAIQPVPLAELTL